MAASTDPAQAITSTRPALGTAKDDGDCFGVADEAAQEQAARADANKAFVLAVAEPRSSRSGDSASRRSGGHQDAEEEDDNDTESQQDDQAERLAADSSQNNESADDE